MSKNDVEAAAGDRIYVVDQQQLIVEDDTKVGYTSRRRDQSAVMQAQWR